MEKNLLSNVDSLFCQVIFFPPNFPFPKYKRKVWREKIYFAKERTPNFLGSQFTFSILFSMIFWLQNELICDLL
jgi:hypothetical protein